MLHMHVILHVFVHFYLAYLPFTSVQQKRQYEFILFFSNRFKLSSGNKCTRLRKFISGITAMP